MRVSVIVIASLSLVVVASTACSKTPSQPAPATSVGTAQPAAAELPVGRASIGQPAPDFTLKDLDGRDVRLSSFKGKTVVLEWFNPGCPFVNASHTKGSLKGAAARHTADGVVWLAINSAAEGKQGFGVDANRDAAKRFGITHPILLDETGAVGKAYGATNTPHLMVIDANGVLVYRGAVDNSPDGEGDSPENGKLVSFVDAALADVAAGRPVAKPETKAYGCGVKYGH